MNDYFETDNLSFIATALITKRAGIQDVYFAPNKRDVKVFRLIPQEAALRLYKAYQLNKVKVPPALIASTLGQIKHYPARILRPDELPIKEVTKDQNEKE